MKPSVLNRKLHRWGAILTALPVGVVIVTGILLQLKKEWSWVQPPTQRSATPRLAVSFDELLRAAQRAPQAAIRSWDDVARVDVRPARGVAKLRAHNRWEVQVDTGTGEVLQVAYRRSDWIESIHDGSFFADGAKLWVFLPTGVILFGLWVTGIYLWLLPHLAKRARRRDERTS